MKDEAKNSTPESDSPCPCQSAEPADSGRKDTRRDFLFKIGLGLNVVAGAAMGIPLVGYVLSSVFKQPVLDWVSLGSVDSFPEGKTRFASFTNPVKREWDGATADIPCWVRRMSGNDFQIFAINCAHLGCPVRWFEESKLFMCPCHGGVYYEDGAVAAGPPPRGLFQYEFKVANGELLIKAGLMPTLATPNV
jgi:Rieske Fe-S protein